MGLKGNGNMSNDRVSPFHYKPVRINYMKQIFQKLIQHREPASLKAYRGRLIQNPVMLGSAVLIAIGLMFGGFSVITQLLTVKNSHAQILQNHTPLNNPNPLITGTPVHLAVPDVNIDLDVVQGHYYPSTNSWTLTLNDAQWGTMTAKPNNKSGLTYIYGHYRVHVFYTLPHIKAGDQALVRTDNGHTFTYTYTNNVVVSPSDTSIFKYEGKPVLVLQTCTGAWYQYRQLFVFNLTKIS